MPRGHGLSEGEIAMLRQMATPDTKNEVIAAAIRRASTTVSEWRRKLGLPVYRRVGPELIARIVAACTKDRSDYEVAAIVHADRMTVRRVRRKYKATPFAPSHPVAAHRWSDSATPRRNTIPVDADRALCKAERAKRKRSQWDYLADAKRAYKTLLQQEAKRGRPKTRGGKVSPFEPREDAA